MGINWECTLPKTNLFQVSLITCIYKYVFKGLTKLGSGMTFFDANIQHHDFDLIRVDARRKF